MKPLSQHEVHQSLNARFTEVNGCEVVSDYGDWLAEHRSLTTSAAAMDLSFRSRICVVGADRASWLNGQVTNNIKNLKPGSGCYAALVSAKGKIQSDFNVFMLPDEILLDFEPGYAASVLTRLEGYIIADDVQLVDASDAYGLLSVQGPRSGEVISKIGLPMEIPKGDYSHATFKDETLGEIYLANHARFGTQGFDLFAPTQSLGAVFDKLAAACGEVGGGLCGWEAMETARIEAGIPRYGMDMDESNLAPETGIEGRAISYSKGCYIGQEVIARIRTYGKVARNLRGLMLDDGLEALPVKGTKILHDGKEVGHITSAVKSPLLNKNIALGYVRKEVNQAGTKLSLDLPGGEGSAVEVVDLPFLNRSAAR